MIKNQQPKAPIVGAAPKMKPAKHMSTRMTKLPGAILRLIVGPPMSERDRYNRDVAEARGRDLVGPTGSWAQFR